MAPSSLLSAMARQSTRSAGLPRPSGSALVCCRPSAASGLHSSGYTLSLHPSGSVRLLLPSGSTLVLCRYSSTLAFWIAASVSVTGAICSTLALQILKCYFERKPDMGTDLSKIVLFYKQTLKKPPITFLIN